MTDYEARQRLQARGKVAAAVRLLAEAYDVICAAAALDCDVVSAETAEEIDGLANKIAREAS